MRIGDHKLPDKCPTDCQFIGDIGRHGQNSICGRCPVFCCADSDLDFRLVEPEDYREDWAAEWAEFFRTGQPPRLRLTDETTKT
jgi:hypothetical protein